MIEINLLPGSGKKSRSTGFSLAAVAGKAGSRVKDPFMIAAAVSIVAAVGSIGLLHVTQNARADEVTERARRARRPYTGLKTIQRRPGLAPPRPPAPPPVPPKGDGAKASSKPAPPPP